MKNTLLILLLFNVLFVYSQETKPTAEPVDKPIEVLEEDKSEEIPFAVIEQVPVYQGCDKTKSNRDLKNCMSEKIQKHVARTFNINVASTNGITGRQRIITSFKIDKEGDVVDVRARASHPALEQEAIRVVNLIPKMDRAGIQRGKPVIVSYSLPMIFQVQEETKKLSKKEKRRKRKEELRKKVKTKN